LAIETVTDVRNIMASPNDPVDPNLQKEMDFVQHLLIQGKTAEVSSTPYLSNIRKKKIKKATYHNLSRGPPF